MLSRRTTLGIAAVLDTARLARVRPLPARELAARSGLAPRQFESLLQDLVRARILKSLRGPHGGYELARERRRISLGDVVRALEGDKRDSRPASPANGVIANVIAPAVADATAGFLARLDEVTIEDLCRRAEAQDAALVGQNAAAAGQNADFAI